MKKILFCLLLLISFQGFSQADYQFDKVTIATRLRFKRMPASASALDSAVCVNRTTGDLEVRKAPAASNLATSDLSADADHTHNFHGHDQTLDSIADLYIFTRGQKFGVKQRASIAFLSNQTLPMLISSVTVNAAANADSISNTIQATANNNAFNIRSSNATTGATAAVDLRNADGTNHTSRIDVYADSVGVRALPVSSADSVYAVGPHKGSTSTNTVYKMPIQKVFKGTTNWTPGIVGAGSSTSTSFTVTGASVGDPVSVCKLSAYSNGEIYDAFVSATNTVTIRVHNVSTGSANYSSAADYNVVVHKY